VTTNWCYPSLKKHFPSPTDRSYQQCLFNRKYLAEHIKDYDFVVFAGSWRLLYDDNILKDVKEAIQYAAANTSFVVVMAAPAAFDVNIKQAYEKSLMTNLEFDINHIPNIKDRQTKEANLRLLNTTKAIKNVIFLTRDDLFNVKGHPSTVTEDNIPYSLDGAHISIYGSKKSAQAFQNSNIYRDFLKLIDDIKANKNN